MLSETLAWRAILALDRLLAARSPQTAPAGRYLVSASEAIALPPGTREETLPDALPDPCIEVHAPAAASASGSSVPGDHAPVRSWRALGPVDPQATRLLDLYLPIVLTPPAPGRPRVVAHLAQSLDGRIATDSGSSQWISGALDQMHNHRMRALCDAVLVGAETVIHDDPQLTCREVEGPHPMRVVLDPRRRVSLDRRVFTDDTAPTVLITCQPGTPPSLPAHVSVITLDRPGGETSGAPGGAPGGEPGSRRDQQTGNTLAPRAILAALAPLGVRRLFVEGGGVTISSFLHERLLDRLQLAVAPMLIGSGRASIQLPAIDHLDHALRPRVRWFVLEPDMLFECELDTADI